VFESDTCNLAYYIKAPGVAKLDETQDRLDIRSSFGDGPVPVAGAPDRRGVL
jgi:hypothetical protein